MLCIVTIHGIGFQQPPSQDGKIPGYADGLHDNLRVELGDLLGDDPNRPLGHAGPVYVQSNWPPFEGPGEDGVNRLGKWRDKSRVSVTVTPDLLLAQPGKQFCHVALVYSGVEEQDWDAPSLIALTSLALQSVLHYSSASGLIRMAIRDVEGILHHQPGKSSESSAPVRRRDRPGSTPRIQADVPTPQGITAASLPGDGALTALKQVEDDVGAYVSRNLMRERVRLFVIDAISRICARDDVDRVVLNGHSNGTVIGFDALKQVSPLLTGKIGGLITAGSPLRKYVDLFSWGSECDQGLLGLQLWHNFWDEADPVADPLDPGGTWRRGDPVQDPLTHLFGLTRSANVRDPRPITDLLVDNLAHSRGGGLQAHNYWDNTQEFVRPFARALKVAAAGP